MDIPTYFEDIVKDAIKLRHKYSNVLHIYSNPGKWLEFKNEVFNTLLKNIIPSCIIMRMM